MARFRLLGLSLILAATSFAFVPAVHAVTEVRQQTTLDAGWRFVRSDVAGAETPGFNDSAWTATSVPHTWNAQDGQDGGSNYYRGVGWYRKHFTPSAGLAGKKLWLQFDGVNSVSDVWVNGTKLGQHKGGFAGFRFDATAAVRLGQDNVLAVKVSNAANADIAPLQADFTFYGGIYRDVSLLAVDPLSVRLGDYGGPGVYVRQRAVTAASADIDVTTKAWNNFAASKNVRLHTVVRDAAGTVVTENTTASRAVAAATGFEQVQRLTIRNPHRWQGKEDPYLYKVSVEVLDGTRVADVVTQPLGLRSSTVDPAAGFSLNGKHLALHGVNAHQDRLDQGWAVPPSQHVQDFDLMDEMGVNALRTAHYQQAQQVYDLADQRGYVVWAEIPLVDKVTDSAAFRANAQQQMYELIRQNFNHPSIAFWGIGNEQRTNDAVTNDILDLLAKQVKAEDSGRFSTYATNQGDTDALSSHADVSGYNRYYGWYNKSATGPGAWADALHAKDPAREIGLSEYGAGASVIQHEENPAPPVTTSRWHPEEYQNILHENHWKQISTRPFLWGTFVWNMFDFGVDSRSEGDTLGRNDKGLVTYDRSIRKDSFYWYKANWTNTPFVYLTSRRWTQRTAASTTVKVYGTADSVSLSLNGTPVSTKTSADHIFTWPITLKPGPNVLTVTGTRAGQTFTDTVTWTLT
ncbi:beta-galactosidase [Amycolatopsis xylanica]|uniref:Beta-galactosidase n=1 Tax=Amycolatopsis xylanica TaxID=589385 RepID=A0A1H3SYF3_9PSEU|nr:glycoside hydrolase family 2 TIM barrel-domain containing protein [Amycolatopsis xylanica]SDZ42964.1 beta-galactosidase [Amycolatopsis xylanica]